MVQAGRIEARRVLWRPPGADATCVFCSTRVACQGMHAYQVALSSVEDSEADTVIHRLQASSLISISRVDFWKG